MGDAIGFDDAGAFEVGLVILEVSEKTDAVADDDRDEVYVDLVEKAGLEVLLSDIGGANGDGALAGDGTGLLEGALDAVGDHGSVGARTNVPLGWIVPEQEEGGAHRVVTAPAISDVEGAPAGDDRPTLEHFLDHRAA